jgi:nucleoid-associated protein YgaU
MTPQPSWPPVKKSKAPKTPKPSWINAKPRKAPRTKPPVPDWLPVKGKKPKPKPKVKVAPRLPPPKPSAAAREIYPGEKIPYGRIGHVTGAGWLTGGRYVTVQAWSLQLKFSATLGPEGMKITGGLGEWQEVMIPRDDPYSEWTGRHLYTATLDILFDGWDFKRRSVEPDLKTLDTLAKRIPGTLSPPSLRIWGAIPKWGLPWVITSIDYGDVIRDLHTGNRLRQAATVSLLEYRPEETVIRTHHVAHKAKPPQKVKVKRGDTLKSIAARYLGNSSKWQQIEKANKGLRGWKIPSHFIGKTIKVPPR